MDGSDLYVYLAWIIQQRDLTLEWAAKFNKCLWCICLGIVLSIQPPEFILAANKYYFNSKIRYKSIESTILFDSGDEIHTLAIKLSLAHAKYCEKTYICCSFNASTHFKRRFRAEALGNIFENGLMIALMKWFFPLGKMCIWGLKLLEISSQI